MIRDGCHGHNSKRDRTVKTSVLKFSKAGLTGLSPKRHKTIDIKAQKVFFPLLCRAKVSLILMTKYNVKIVHLENVSFCREDKGGVQKIKMEI